MKRPSKHNRIGFILWEGPSLFDQAPIVVIATGLGKRWRDHGNSKCGDMIQTWILRQDIPPTEARRNGADASVCGDCPLRGNRGCYVNSCAPTVIWKRYRAGAYHRLDPQNPAHLDLFRGRTIRIGSYGDPCASPLRVWLPILEAVAGHTGYTHASHVAPWQWRQYLMASVSTQHDATLARIRGYSTFRILRPGEQRTTEERACPSDRMTCETCRGCNGNRSPHRTIPLHGPPPVQRKYLATIT